jgi:hypothetical protein
MPFRRLAENSAFGPDEIAVLVAAFEEALQELGLTDREDPATLMVAERIIKAANKGGTRSGSIARSRIEPRSKLVANLTQNSLRARLDHLGRDLNLSFGRHVSFLVTSRHRTSRSRRPMEFRCPAPRWRGENDQVWTADDGLDSAD